LSEPTSRPTCAPKSTPVSKSLRSASFLMFFANGAFHPDGIPGSGIQMKSSRSASVTARQVTTLRPSGSCSVVRAEGFSGAWSATAGW
jgi:hypothetical protein